MYIMDENTVVALLNLQWLIRNRNGGFHPEVDCISWGEGGAASDTLFDKGLTPAWKEYCKRIEEM